MTTELSLIPHPSLNEESYSAWNTAFNTKQIPTLLLEKVARFIEAFQSEVIFTRANSSRPIAASYGAGPCMIVGASISNLGFVAHFSHALEVIIGAYLIIDFLQNHLPNQKEKFLLQLHVRGGIKGDPISQETYRNILKFLKIINSHNFKFSCSIKSFSSLKSHSDNSESLAIDTRNGSVSNYDPLTCNPKNYRRLTEDDVLFAQQSFEVSPALKAYYSF